MEDKELLRQLSQLKQVKPRQDWVLSAKTRMFEGEPQGATPAMFAQVVSVMRIYFAKPAFVMPVLAALVFGGILVQLAQNSVPGDRLYAVRAAIEQVQSSVVAEEPALAHIERAQSRLNDLRSIAQSNRVRNLDPAIREFQRSVAEASREVDELVGKEPEKALQASRELVQLEKEKTEVEQILGTTIGSESSGGLQNATKRLVKQELADLETRTLTEEQAELLEEAQAAAEEGDWQGALEYIFEIGQK